MDALTAIFNHPQLDKYFVGNVTLYRGACLDDRELIDNYEIGDTILTTTFLSTSWDRSVALAFCGDASEKSFPVLWTYKIDSARRRSAINIRTLSIHPDEQEVLILRYVPFTIVSIDKHNDGRTDIYLAQCPEQVTESNQSMTNNNIAFQLDACRTEHESATIDLTRSCVYFGRSCRNQARVEKA